MKIKLYMLAAILLISNMIIIHTSCASEQDIKDAILERRIFTDAELQEMDINNDGKVDVADLVHCINSGACSGEPESLVGEHVGIMVRDNSALIEGQSQVYGQMPFALNITQESPLKGEIDNRSDSELGHYSLYFPNQQIPLTFLNGAEEFRIEFKTVNSNLAPESELLRTITFKGTFSDTTRRVLGGTYQETIAGFKDNRSADIPIKLTGKFMLVFSK